MSFIFKICPCLTWVFKKKPQSPSKKYDGVNELQQQEFMHNLENQAMKLEGSTEKIQQSSIEEQLNVELGLNKPEKLSDYFTETPIDKQRNDPSQSSQKEQLIDFSDDNKTSFRLNMAEYDQYYSIIQEASKEIPAILSEEGYAEINLAQENLNSKLKLWGNNTNRGGKFILDFQLPCTYYFYEQISSRKISQKQNKTISEYRQIESLKSNLNVKYICFNKLSMLEPRDFTYLKYTNGVEGEHWQVCISKDEFHPKDSKVKMGKVHLVSRINEKDGNIKIRTYISLDLNGSIIENLWGKIYNQLTTYIEEMWKEASENFQEELV